MAKAKNTKAGGKSKRTSGKPSGHALLDTASKSDAPEQERLDAISQLPDVLCADENSFATVVGMLKDRSQPIEVRLAALQALQAASFSVVSFESCRGDYTEALRAVMDDPDAEMRQRVLGMLMRQKDPVAQQRLTEGLRNPERALVPPEKALQLLAYDIHNEAYDIARQIVANPPNMEAKREAVRLLASDATAVPILEKVLHDKDEYAEVRQTSAAALNTINPELMQKHAKEILLDPTDFPEIQATSLTALNQFGVGLAMADPQLRDRINTLANSDSTLLQESARSFIDRHDV